MADSIRDGVYLNTTDVFDSIDTSRIINSPDEFRNFLTRLRQSVNNINNAVNLKDTGFYILNEIANGQLFFPDPALNSTTVFSFNFFFKNLFKSDIIHPPKIYDTLNYS